MSRAIGGSDDCFAITESSAYQGSNDVPFSFPMGRVLEDRSWGMIDGPWIACTASRAETKVPSYRLSSGGEVIEIALELRRSDQRKFG